jgi:hypothetical protein
MIEAYPTTTDIETVEIFSESQLAEIADLPIELIKTYDTETLLNLVLRHRKIRLSEINSLCADRLNMNRVYYANALAWALEMQGEPSIQGLISQYLVAESIFNGVLGQVKLPQILQDSIKPDYDLSEDKLAKYSLLPLMSESFGLSNNGADAEVWWGYKLGKDKVISINLDKPIGLALSYDDVPKAVMSLGASAPNELMLYQIQGVKPKPAEDRLILNCEKRKYSTWGLEPLDWKQAMVQIGQNLASNLGFELVAVQSAANNYWVNRLDKKGNISMRLEDAEKIYDLTAISMGFELRDDGNWHKPISSS